MRYAAILMGLAMMALGGCFWGPKVDTTLALQRELRKRSEAIVLDPKRVDVWLGEII